MNTATFHSFFFCAVATTVAAEVMDKLPEWDASKSDDPQYMMNMAKKFVIMDTLKKHPDSKCTFKVNLPP